MPNEPHVLFVDDEESLRTTLPLLLEAHGFKVTAVGTVPEALALISQSKFDALIADLNIGSAGDGFTVVSAMRRTQPNAATFILTGYPAIDSALEAIRQQVDDYLTKPTDAESLVAKLRSKLERHEQVRQPPPKRLAEILSETKDEMIQQWLNAVEADPEIRRIPLTLEQRKDHLPQVLDVAIRIVSGNQISAAENAAAAAHGSVRRKQGYSVPLLIREARLLHNIIAHCIQDNLLRIQISNLIPDMVHALDTVDALLEESCRAFLSSEHKLAVRKREKAS